jgi:hypothetical protein
MLRPDEVDGGSRRPGCSSGRPALFCIPGGSQTRRDDAGVDPRRPTASRGASAPEAGTGDYRQSIRQRSAAHSFAASRDRTDLPAQEESRSSGHAGWPSATPVPKTLGDRTHDRLARKLPALGSTLRPFAEDLCCVLSYCLLHDRLTEGCAIASSWNRHLEKSSHLDSANFPQNQPCYFGLEQPEFLDTCPCR